MKKNIFIFLLGILVSICIGAGISNSELLTVKPATPKSVIVLQSEWDTMDNTQKRILNYTKQGYIVSSTVGIDTRAFIIMEKY